MVILVIPSINHCQWTEATGLNGPGGPLKSYVPSPQYLPWFISCFDEKEEFVARGVCCKKSKKTLVLTNQTYLIILYQKIQYIG